jgi:hypothetical protein
MDITSTKTEGGGSVDSEKKNCFSLEDEPLKRLLSDKLLSEFDCAHWISANEKYEARFVQNAFPVLANYYAGQQLEILVSKNEWLADLSLPSKRYKSASFFHSNSAQNLIVLDLFIKLNFLECWGRCFVEHSPMMAMLFELVKIVERDRLSNASPLRCGTASSTPKQETNTSQSKNTDTKQQQSCPSQDDAAGDADSALTDTKGVDVKEIKPRLEERRQGGLAIDGDGLLPKASAAAENADSRWSKFLEK